MSSKVKVVLKLLVESELNVVALETLSYCIENVQCNKMILIGVVKRVLTMRMTQINIIVYIYPYTYWNKL